MRKQEKGNAIDPPELNEKDTLLEELCEKEESFAAKHDDDKKAKNAEKQSAEQLRQQAMERMRKRKGNDGEGGGKKSRRSGVELVEYLREKTESEKELRQQELDIKKREIESRAKQHDDLLKIMAQQQMAMMAMMQKMMDK